jgi:hypothetical protein
VRIDLRPVPALVLILLAVAGPVAAARADGLDRTAVGMFCEGTGYEGATMIHRCEALVQDGAAAPTPPTGTMTMNGSITCALAPISADTSECEFALSTPAEGDTRLVARYPGDAGHAASELLTEWDVGPPDIGWRRGSLPLFGIIAPPTPPRYPPYLLAPATEESTPAPAPAPAPSAPAATRPPRPRFAAHPAKRTRLRLARFRFGGAGGHECRLDGASYRPCGAVFRRRVAPGPHVLRVRAAAGDPVASFRWRVLPSG